MEWYAESHSRHAGVCYSPVCAADSVEENKARVMETSTIVFTQWLSLLSETFTGPSQHSVIELSCSVFLFLIFFIFLGYDSGECWANLLCKTETGSPAHFCPSPLHRVCHVRNAVTGSQQGVLYVFCVHEGWWIQCSLNGFDKMHMAKTSSHFYNKILDSNQYNTFKLLYVGVFCLTKTVWSHGDWQEPAANQGREWLRGRFSKAQPIITTYVKFCYFTNYRCGSLNSVLLQ